MNNNNTNNNKGSKQSAVTTPRNVRGARQDLLGMSLSLLDPTLAYQPFRVNRSTSSAAKIGSGDDTLLNTLRLDTVDPSGIPKGPRTQKRASQVQSVTDSPRLEAQPPVATAPYIVSPPPADQLLSSHPSGNPLAPSPLVGTIGSGEEPLTFAPLSLGVAAEQTSKGSQNTATNSSSNKNDESTSSRRARILMQHQSSSDSFLSSTFGQAKDRFSRWNLRRFLVHRIVNMSVAAIVCALFLLYPALVQSAAALLDCIDVDTISGVVRVVRTDTTLYCHGERYERARVAAWCVLTLVGVGGPLLSALAVLALSRWTCDDSLSAARMIMYFMTGGYRAGAWYWGCIVLLRKLLLVICVTMLSGGMTAILGCIWTLGAVAALTVLSHPFDRTTLQFADLLSQCSTAIIFGLGGVTLMVGADEYGTSMGILVGVLHLCVLTLFALMILRLLIQAIRSVLDQTGLLMGMEHVQRLDEQAASHLNDIREIYPRFFNLLVISHNAEQFLKKISSSDLQTPRASPRATSLPTHSHNTIRSMEKKKSRKPTNNH